MRALLFAVVLVPTVLWASQTYVPPPPPKLPAMLSEKMVNMGRDLFEDNVLKDQGVEIHNYVGRRPCSACHDASAKIHPDALAAKFRDIRTIINAEILKQSQGWELPPQDPALEALVQYIVHKYKLYEYKLSK